jgi:hypothetical protein
VGGASLAVERADRAGLQENTASVSRSVVHANRRINHRLSFMTSDGGLTT